jgi:hypothetical protein
MRTKTLLLIAAAVAAGIATSVAQVFSVNAVGYVNKTVPANGFAMISNPLTAANNSIAQLFQGVPNGFQVFVYTPQGFALTTYDEFFGGWEPEALANQQLLPGQGVFVKNPTANQVTITFVGEVPQGDLTAQLPQGLQVVSSKVPQAGTPTDLGLPGAAGDQIFQWNTATQSYAFSAYDDLFGGWEPALRPLEVGDAFFLRKAAAGTWPRNFNVNQ